MDERDETDKRHRLAFARGFTILSAFGAEMSKEAEERAYQRLMIQGGNIVDIAAMVKLQCSFVPHCSQRWPARTRICCLTVRGKLAALA